MSRGAKVFIEPYEIVDDHGTMVRAAIHTYGEVVQIFIEREHYNGFLSAYQQWDSDYNPQPTGLKYVDHMVSNVELGAMNKWVKFYEEVMGFAQILSFDDKDIPRCLKFATSD